jgi:hypothetical protein
MGFPEVHQDYPVSFQDVVRVSDDGVSSTIHAIVVGISAHIVAELFVGPAYEGFRTFITYFFHGIGIKLNGLTRLLLTALKRARLQRTMFKYISVC